jgi:hypothetical protein
MEDRWQSRRLIGERLGIWQAADAITFDHENYWKRRLQFCVVDLARFRPTVDESM